MYPPSPAWPDMFIFVMILIINKLLQEFCIVKGLKSQKPTRFLKYVKCLCHTENTAMELLSISLIAVGLSADCFAVSLSASITDRTLSRWQGLRLAAFFGFFQALMPLIGWLAGRTIVDLIASYDHWVAFGLLAFVGGKMLWEVIHREVGEAKVGISQGWMLLTLSLATSLDALAVGLAFAFAETSIWLAAPIIGGVCFIISAIGFLVGKKLSSVIGKRAEAIGGIILIGIGIRILLTHLLG